MSDADESSVVEYSLSELGFILVFVLLLLSGWESNSYNAVKLSDDQVIIKLTEEVDRLKTIIDPGWDDEMILVSKDAWVAQTEEIEKLKSIVSDTAPDDKNDILPSPEDTKEPDTAPDDKNDVLPAPEDTKEPDTRPIVLAGGDSWCTYRQPDDGSDNVYGKTVAIGAIVVGEDGLTLVSKNTSLQHESLVDIAGEEYDTSLVSLELEDWPLNEMLTPTDFRIRGRRFVEIGDIPSDKRVECRFGMDYYIPVYSERSINNLQKVFNSIFHTGSKLTKEEHDELITPAQAIIDPSVTVDIEPKPTPPELKRQVNPDYPPKAFKRRVSGSVLLEYVINKSGRVENIKVVKEIPVGFGFADAAKEAITRWKFEPSMVEGRAVESELQLKLFNFKP